VTLPAPRLRTRIFLAVSALVVLVLLAALGLVQLAVARQAERALVHDLRTTGQVFSKLVAERGRRLATGGALLAADFALKRVLATRDAATLTSAAESYRARVGADLVWVLDETGVLLGDAAGTRMAGEALGREPPVAEAIAGGREAAAIALVDGALVQLVAVPVLGPDPIGWLVLGARIDADTAAALHADTGSSVSFVARGRVLASTWPPTADDALVRATAAAGRPDAPYLARVDGAQYLSLVLPVASRVPDGLVALVQRSWDEELAPLRALRRRLVAIGLAALAAALALGAVLAGGITAPIERLVGGMREVLRGNLGHRVPVARRDEVGFLASAFNEMAGGLEERARIRDVMDKVVSPEVAHELLARGVALGGELRAATVLFADVRGFTTLAERTSPEELLEVLNAYLTAMTRAIEGERGVVDKYIGDEVMAVFGAPLDAPDDAARAVAAALRMLAAVDELNAARRPAIPLRIGIGIATGPVVAGNVGSPDRLNYTVLGDTVNLASRLQGLTKEYGVPLLLTEETSRAAGGTGRCLGEAAVRGRDAAVRVYTVDAAAAAAPRASTRAG
jgi:adenylate cyclase